MRRLRIICVTLVAFIALILPETAFAQNAQDPDPGQDWNITIEFRYTKGEESSFNIPDSIARYGRSYHLINKTKPVLEKKLPATREYTWLVDGTISQDEMSLLDGMEGVELTPTGVEIGRVVDKTVKESYPTNDVEDIALIKTIDGDNFYRAAVRFEVEGYDDYDLPVSYQAEVIYRGMETYIGPGYIVKATYTTSEDLEGVPQYVVVATYAPDGLVPISSTAGTSGGGNNNTGSTETTEALPDEVITTPVVDEGAVTDVAIEPAVDTVADITDEAVPLADGNVTEKTSSGINPIALILIIIAAAFGGFIAWMFLTRRKHAMEKRILREERRKAALRSHGLVEYDGQPIV